VCVSKLNTETEQKKTPYFMIASASHPIHNPPATISAMEPTNASDPLESSSASNPIQSASASHASAAANWWSIFSEKVRVAYKDKQATEEINQVFHLEPAPLSETFHQLFIQCVQASTEWSQQPSSPSAIQEFRKKYTSLFDNYPKLAQRIMERNVDPLFLRLTFAQAQEIQKIRNHSDCSDEEKTVQLKQVRNTLTQFFTLQSLHAARCTSKRE